MGVRSFFDTEALVYAAVADKPTQQSIAPTKVPTMLTINKLHPRRVALPARW